jgi:hypothetical protein
VFQVLPNSFLDKGSRTKPNNYFLKCHVLWQLPIHLCYCNAYTTMLSSTLLFPDNYAAPVSPIGVLVRLSVGQHKGNTDGCTDEQMEV